MKTVAERQPGPGLRERHRGEDLNFGPGHISRARTFRTVLAQLRFALNDGRQRSGVVVRCLLMPSTSNRQPARAVAERISKMSDVQQHLQQLRHALLSSRNADGGWGYHVGKASRLEPTCWALLALAPHTTDRAVLRNWPAREGLLLERAGGSPNFAFHALALLTLQALRDEHGEGNGMLIAALQRVKGEMFPQSQINRQNNGLEGWSWIAGTFSWVEPTAWALLALKRWATSTGLPVDANRVSAAEELLSDRCCRDGGWNYGNSNMLGQELKPFVPPTAIALLALRDRASIPAVRRSVEFLHRAAATEPSGVALSLALLALRGFGQPTSEIRAALLQQVPTTLEFGNRMAAALSLFALGGEEDHAALFV